MHDRRLRLVMVAVFALLAVAAVKEDAGGPAGSRFAKAAGTAVDDPPVPGSTGSDSGEGGHAGKPAPVVASATVPRPNRATGPVAPRPAEPAAAATDARAVYVDLLPAAEGGDPRAQYRLAMILRACAGAPAGEAEIERTLERNAFRFDQGEVRAELEARLSRCAGLVGPEESVLAEASAWVRRAAEAGDPVARADLALSGEASGPNAYAGVSRAELVREALIRRPVDAIPLAGAYAAATIPAHTQPGSPDASAETREAEWANNAWWLAECAVAHTCERERALQGLRDVYVEYEIEEILAREQLILGSVATGQWTDATLEKLGILAP